MKLSFDYNEVNFYLTSMLKLDDNGKTGDTIINNHFDKFQVDEKIVLKYLN